MGTRSITIIKGSAKEGEADRVLLRIYRQFDGYPSGMGYELAKILAPIAITQGISGDGIGMAMTKGEKAQKRKYAATHANGMNELAAKVLVALKTKHPIGNVYVSDPNNQGYGWADYIYTIEQLGAEAFITCHNVKSEFVLGKVEWAGRAALIFKRLDKERRAERAAWRRQRAAERKAKKEAA